MRKDFIALCAFASIGLVGACGVSCTNNHKSEERLNRIFALNDSITELNMKIDSLTQRESITIWHTCYELNERGKQVKSLQLYYKGGSYYCGYSSRIVPVDKETYIYLKHAEEYGINFSRIAECECGKYHVLHNEED